MAKESHDQDVFPAIFSNSKPFSIFVTSQKLPGLQSRQQEALKLK